MAAKGARRFKKGDWESLKSMIHGADVIVELVDARDIKATRLPLAERWAGSKRLLVIANKKDLLPQGTDCPALPNKGIYFSAKSADERERRKLIRSILDRTEARPVKALFLGYPNVGKSSLINLLARRQAAKVSPIAGTTKNIQWVKISEELIVSDYRGVFPRYEKEEELVRKGALNVTGREERHAYRFAHKILGNLILRNWMEKRYDLKLDSAKEPEDVLIIMAKRRGWLNKGGEPNLEEAARQLVRAMKEAPEI